MTTFLSFFFLLNVTLQEYRLSACVYCAHDPYFTHCTFRTPTPEMPELHQRPDAGKSPCGSHRTCNKSSSSRECADTGGASARASASVLSHMWHEKEFLLLLGLHAEGAKKEFSPIKAQCSNADGGKRLRARAWRRSTWRTLCPAPPRQTCWRLPTLTCPSPSPPALNHKCTRIFIWLQQQQSNDLAAVSFKESCCCSFPCMCALVELSLALSVPANLLSPIQRMGRLKSDCSESAQRQGRGGPQRTLSPRPSLAHAPNFFPLLPLRTNEDFSG